MTFIADLHIHSRFSRATSKQLSPRHLAAWARCKGINVLGTGDFTHPQWRDELRQQLVRDEVSGLYRLSGPAEELDFLQGKTPPDADGPLFLLQTEISSIYKRQGKVRKVHNLIFVPTLDDADRLSQRLELVGNLHADVMFNVLHLFGDNNLNCKWDLSPYVGIGWAHVYDSPKKSSVSGNFGLLGSYNINETWAVNADLRGVLLSDGLDGEKGARAEGDLSFTLGVSYKF